MRVHPIVWFVFSGGLLIFFSPYLVHKAATKHLPWLVPIIVIPIYAASVSYWAYKLFWHRVIGKPPTATHADNNAGR